MRCTVRRDDRDEPRTAPKTQRPLIARAGWTLGRLIFSQRRVAP